ncbi:MAG: hypothetical protein ACI8RD_005066 [Bacillariaceae sp.]|jgi:hypothetical protein
MRFSISRDTLALFVETFYDEQEEEEQEKQESSSSSSSSSSFNAANYSNSKSVDVLSNELRGTYLLETEDVLNIQNEVL